MKTSDSSLSRYCGRPLSVLRVMAGSVRCQPKPKAPLPAPESYERESCGPKSERPGLVAMGTVMEPVPVTGLAANFSPMLRIAPPPWVRKLSAADGDSCEMTRAKATQRARIAYQPFVRLHPEP